MAKGVQPITTASLPTPKVTGTPKSKAPKPAKPSMKSVQALFGPKRTKPTVQSVPTKTPSF